MNRISETDLILNPDGSVYHLNLQPGDVANTVILVGDPDRVEKVSSYFDEIEIIKSKREFTTHTGFIAKRRMTVISTGISTDNIDIVLNELDALVNVNLKTRVPFDNLKSLNIIRIGTSGALQGDLPVDTLMVSPVAIGLDSLMHFYAQDPTAYEQELLADFKKKTPVNYNLNPYIASADKELLSKLGGGLRTGITLTCPGFYAPQGRQLRSPVAFPDLLKTLTAMEICGQKITNFEMETAGIYGLAACLAHKAISFSVILANRFDDTFSGDPASVIDSAIKTIVERMINKL